MNATVKQPSAWLPIVMSLAALTLVGVHVAVSGTAHQVDEGAAAHLWQLLMAGQLPIIGYFFLSSITPRSQPTVLILALQAVAYLAALLPVYLLHF